MVRIGHWMRMRYFNFRSHGNRESPKGGITELRNHGTTELRNKAALQRNYGNTDLRNYESTNNGGE
jgi:hypothetical protein